MLCCKGTSSCHLPGGTVQLLTADALPTWCTEAWGALLQLCLTSQLQASGLQCPFSAHRTASTRLDGMIGRGHEENYCMPTLCAVGCLWSFFGCICEVIPDVNGELRRALSPPHHWTLDVDIETGKLNLKPIWLVYSGDWTWDLWVRRESCYHWAMESHYVIPFLNTCWRLWNREIEIKINLTCLEWGLNLGPLS